MVVSALKEGTVCFPRITLMAISGPLIVGQLLETTLLNLVCQLQRQDGAHCCCLFVCYFPYPLYTKNRRV